MGLLETIKNLLSKSVVDETAMRKKWLTWVGEIQEKTAYILEIREIQSRYLEIVDKNKQIQNPPDFHRWVLQNYGASVVMSIRRQLDMSPDVVSLRRLLAEMSVHPKVVSRNWFRSFYTNPHTNPDGDFSVIAGSGEYFDPEIAKKDIKDLDTLGRNIKKYANKELAHNTNTNVSVTYKEINNFIESLDKMVSRYYLLFTGSSMESSLPIWQYDWQEIFTKPWIARRTDQV
ncbi:MAG: hypothetical protein WD187_04695 [Candidatus Woykebacteria bacterium]